MRKIERYYSSECRRGADLQAAYAEGQVATNYRGLKDVSQAMKVVSDTLFEHDRNVKGLAVMDALSGAAQDSLDQEVAYKSKKGKLATEVLTETKKFHDDQIKHYTREFTPEQANAFKQRYVSIQMGSLNTAFSYQQQQEQVYRKEVVENNYTSTSRQVIKYGSDALQSTVPQGIVEAEGKYKQAVDNLMSAIDMTLPPGEATTQLKATYAARLGVRFRGYNQGLQWLKDPKNIRELLPETRKSLLREFEIEWGNEKRLEAKEDDERIHKLNNEMFTSLIKNEMTLTMPPLII